MSELAEKIKEKELMHRLACSINDAAFMIGVGRETMLFLVRSAQLSAFKYGQNGTSGKGKGKWIIPRKSLEAWLQRETAKHNGGISWMQDTGGIGPRSKPKRGKKGGRRE